MTKRTRTVLFIICVIFFVSAAPLIIFYSQGYRFDFETKKIVRTGALYFRASPRSAEVYINEKFREKTSIITSAVLIENLIPKTYKVEIKKDGYYTWQKNLEVKEKQVTEAKNIFLIPKNPNFTFISTSTNEINNIISEIETSATSSDKEKVIEFNDYEIWVLFPKRQGDEPQRDVEEKIFLTRFSEKIGNVFWLNNYYLIFNVGDKLKIAEIDDRDRINIVDLAEFLSPEIFWDRENEKLYLLTEGGLYISDKLLP